MGDKLYRSKSDCMVGGVAAGLANYFGLDVTVVRLVWLVAMLIGGSGFILYIVAWIIIPPAPTGEPTSTFEKGEHIRERVIETAKSVEERMKGQSQSGHHEQTTDRTGERKQVLGWLLIGAGVVFLARNVFSWLSLGYMWPLLIILVGAVLIFQEFRR